MKQTWCLTCTETIRLIVGGGGGGGVWRWGKTGRLYTYRYTETIRLIRDGEKGCGRGYDDNDDELMLNVLRCQLTY